LEFTSVAELPTAHGTFRCRVVREDPIHEHIVLWKGEIEGRTDVAVRIHSECLTGEAFGSLRCDCDQQLANSLDFIESTGEGMLIYLRQEGRGIGLFNKIDAYALQDGGLDTIEANRKLGLPADARCYRIAAKILHHFKIPSVRLLTNNPRKIEALQEQGILVKERIPLVVPPNGVSASYLNTKRHKMAHML
jgi:GTP cyclohydrolase II